MATKKKPSPPKPIDESSAEPNPDAGMRTLLEINVGTPVLVKLPPEFKLDEPCAGIVTRLKPPAVTVFIPGNELYLDTFAHIVDYPEFAK